MEVFIIAGCPQGEENLWGGRTKYKKNSSKEKLNEINPKKYSCYGLKKMHTRNLITKKNSWGPKIPPPPPPP